MKTKRRVAKLLTFLGVIFFGISAWVIYNQEYLVLPYYYQTQVESGGKREEAVPKGAVRELIGPSGAQIETLVYIPKHAPLGLSVSFRGNANGLQDHVALPEWAAEYGFLSVIFNYPGMGLSDGVPSEQGILEAGERVIKHFRSRAPGKLWLIGYSFGTGPAGTLAGKFQPEILVLFAPFTDLKDIIRRRPQFALYAPFSRLSFPLEEPISSLQKTNLIIATGGADTVIPIENSESVYAAYRGLGQKIWVSNPTGLHDRLLGANRPELDRALQGLGLESFSH